MGAIEIRTSFFPLAFLLFLFPAKATIDDGPPIPQGWGTRLYPIPPGRHRVRVWCPYLFFNIGDSYQDLEVTAGQVTGIEWKCPIIVFMQATWVPLGVRPLGAHELAAASAPGGQGPGQRQAPGQDQGPGYGQDPPAASSAPAGWHPDPHGQAALRYWDGQHWSEHTHNG